MERIELSPAAEIHILAGMLMKAARRDLGRRLDSCGVHLAPLAFGVMRLLGHRDHTLSELSRHMRLSPATLLPVIDSLERERFAQRGHDPQDRRRTPISVTPAGREMLARVPLLDSSDTLENRLDAMGEQKVAHLLQLLRELAGGLPGCPKAGED